MYTTLQCIVHYIPSWYYISFTYCLCSNLNSTLHAAIHTVLHTASNIPHCTAYSTFHTTLAIHTALHTSIEYCIKFTTMHTTLHCIVHFILPWYCIFRQAYCLCTNLTSPLHAYSIEYNSTMYTTLQCIVSTYYLGTLLRSHTACVLILIVHCMLQYIQYCILHQVYHNASNIPQCIPHCNV